MVEGRGTMKKSKWLLGNFNRNNRSYCSKSLKLVLIFQGKLY
jgi:hypothetical protein